MNTPVSFELSKLLKEKGFNIPYPNVESSYPTIVEVVMWLYEKHGIWIDIRYMDEVLGFGFCVTTLEDNTEQHELYNYKSPTEAYSQAIEFTLKNLI